jgi:hypothetical protein
MITAQCHCGNIKIEVNNLPDTLTECNCSICRRLAARWLYYTSNEVSIKIDNTPPQPYEWGDKDITFLHCPICGCNTHYISTDLKEFDRIAINANMLEPKLLHKIKIRRFNGAQM